MDGSCIVWISVSINITGEGRKEGRDLEGGAHPHQTEGGERTHPVVVVAVWVVCFGICCCLFPLFSLATLSPFYTWLRSATSGNGRKRRKGRTKYCSKYVVISCAKKRILFSLLLITPWHPVESREGSRRAIKEQLEMGWVGLVCSFVCLVAMER